MQAVNTRWLEDFCSDLRYALRGLRNSPGFTAVAVFSLALGVGLNTGMFSVIDAVLLRPLPYPAAGELVRVGHDRGAGDVTVSEYRFWKEQSRVFSSLAGYRGVDEQELTVGSNREWIRAAVITADFFRTLGIAPARGREFDRTETTAGGPHAIVLSDSLWRRTFGADAAILGRSVRLNRGTFTVVGVLPANFWFPQTADAFVPLQPSGSLSDQGTNTTLIARLRNGLTLSQARAEMALIAGNYRRSGESNQAAASGEVRDFSVISFQDSLLGDARINLLLLFGATALLLLIACSNLATLLLTRAISRTKEIALRLALGSTGGRLYRQFLVESLAVAMLGACSGLLAAWGVVRVLVAWLPFEIPSANPVRVDSAVLLFTTAVAVTTAGAFTLVPLLVARGMNLSETLKSLGRISSGAAPAAARRALVITEVALATVLLIGAGLLIQSLHRLYSERLGFTPQGLITFETPFSPARQRNNVERQTFTRAVFDRLQSLPGVRGVAASNVLPLAGFGNLPTQRQGHPEQSIGGMEIRPVTPEYFELMGIPVRRGRSFTGSDRSGSLPVAVINETLARTWWPKGDSIGDTVVVGEFRGRVLLPDVPRAVIGVAADTRVLRNQPAPPTIYIPLSQTDAFPPSTLAWIVRGAHNNGIGSELRHTVAAIDPAQRVEQIRTLDEIVSASTAGSRFNATLFALLAAAALALAVLGVYGLLSFLVAQRRREIGTRLALGATGADILGLFLKQGAGLTAIGLGLGLGAAFFLTHYLASLLYGVQTRDFWTFAAASLVLFAAAMAAILLPARRAAKIDPMTALRYE